MMGTYLSFYFYFFLKAKTQISALVEFTESFLQYHAPALHYLKDCIVVIVYHTITIIRV